jgi:hypothetical protein
MRGCSAADEGGSGGASGTTSSTDTCDQDDDGAPGPQCLGNDCCDTNPDVRPDQTHYFGEPNDCTGWDYNCATGDGDTLRDEAEPCALTPAEQSDVALRQHHCEQKNVGGWLPPAPNCGEYGELVEDCRWDDTAAECVYVLSGETAQQRCH